MRIINRFPLPAAMAWLVGAVLFVPIAWMVLTAIRPEHELYQVPLRILPGALDMANIQSAWYEKSFGQFFFNSAVNSVLSVLFSMPIGILAGYAFRGSRSATASTTGPMCCSRTWCRSSSWSCRST